MFAHNTLLINKDIDQSRNVDVYVYGRVDGGYNKLYNTIALYCTGTPCWCLYFVKSAEEVYNVEKTEKEKSESERKKQIIWARNFISLRRV